MFLVIEKFYKQNSSQQKTLPPSYLRPQKGSCKKFRLKTP